MLSSVINTSIGGNEVWRWILFCIALLCSLVIGRLSSFYMLRMSKRSLADKKESAGVFFKALARSTLVLWFAVVSFMIVRSGLLILPHMLYEIFDTSTGVLFSGAIGYVVYCMVDLIDYKLGGIAKKTDNKVDDMLVPMVGKSIRVTVIVFVVLQVVQNLSNKPLTSILAGLGVGGLAVALAGQDTIKNIFGALVIIGDKPFEIGDRILIDGHDGPVESVGFRSTKVRTLDGHLVSVPNSDIVNKTIKNIGKRPFIKHVANVGITYDTPPEKVDQALDIIKELLQNHEGMNSAFPPRVYFNAFNDWSLNIIVIFWYHPPDYWKYMEFTDKFNRQLLQRFNQAGISFAFPTQTLYVSGGEKESA